MGKFLHIFAILFFCFVSCFLFLVFQVAIAGEGLFPKMRNIDLVANKRFLKIIGLVSDES